MGMQKGGDEDVCQQHPGDLLEQAAILHIFAPYDTPQAMGLEGSYKCSSCQQLPSKYSTTGAH